VTERRFERDTAVERVDDRLYRGEVDPGWAVVDGAAPNGGYLLAIAARAMRAPIDHPDPVTITGHFLAPPEPGDVDVEVEVVRAGRRHSTVAASLRQDGREMVRLLGAFGDLARADGMTRVDRLPPSLPPVDSCERFSERTIERAESRGKNPPPILLRFDHRTPPGMMGWAEGAPTGKGEMGGWIRWADEAEMDTIGLLAVSDAYPPAVFNSGEGSYGWVPTIELTVQVRKRPAPGWLATRFTTEAVTAGYLEEDGEVWDADGDLVVLSRQLALAARPRRSS
jgi:acyl-CoA thioesterase